MIEFRKGDIFESGADILVCPVNCVGVMGKGLAKAFKERFKGLEAYYKESCKNEAVDIVLGRVGVNHIRIDLFYSHEQIILLLPTKKHWKDPSKIEWVEEGIEKISFLLWYDSYNQGYNSISIPALGCGCGELNWADVKPLFEKYLSDLPNEIYVYEPL